MATKNTVRKAVMVKHTPYKFGKRFSKGDKVEVQEVPLGKGRYSYVVSNPVDSSILAQNVGRSFFEYDEEETFVVMVTRISSSTRSIISLSSTISHLFRKTIIFGTPTCLAKSTCSRV